MDLPHWQLTPNACIAGASVGWSMDSWWTYESMDGPWARKSTGAYGICPFFLSEPEASTSRPMFRLSLLVASDITTWHFTQVKLIFSLVFNFSSKQNFTDFFKKICFIYRKWYWLLHFFYDLLKWHLSYAFCQNVRSNYQHCWCPAELITGRSSNWQFRQRSETQSEPRIRGLAV